MQAKLKVVTTDGEYTVQTTLANVVAWERRFKAKVSQMAEGMGLEDLAFLAWEASKSAGIVVPIVFDDFIATLITVEGEDEGANPSHAAPTPEV